jgi:2-isopropylmalate synthase
MVELYDTTGRDGCQGSELDLTVQDKLRLAHALDAFGVRYIEMGWPGSNPRDSEFFARAKAELVLKQATLVAFGATARPGVLPEHDPSIRALLQAETSTVAAFGKASHFQVRTALRIQPAKNLALVRDTVAYLKQQDREVVFDAEHFFDGWKQHRDYALRCCLEAVRAGADVLCLCDTNGGCLPHEIAAGVRAVKATLRRLRRKVRLGVHCHNDGELAVANTLAAVREGVTHVQGTINGFGERCGNANLCSVVANLLLKMGVRVVSNEQLQTLVRLSRLTYELAQLDPPRRQAFVGATAFGHKGGVHVSAVGRDARTYEHVAPELVGNRRQVLVSDYSGRASIVAKARQFGVALWDEKVPDLVAEVKRLEHAGYNFEQAEGSLELLFLRYSQFMREYFRVVERRLVDEKTYWRYANSTCSDFGLMRRVDEPANAWALVQLRMQAGAVNEPLTGGRGNGPVNALDAALRQALCRHFPEVAEVQLLDYKVRVLDGGQGTGRIVRVLIESGDGRERWTTVGVNHDVIEASFQALEDSLRFKLWRTRR